MSDEAFDRAVEAEFERRARRHRRSAWWAGAAVVALIVGFVYLMAFRSSGPAHVDGEAVLVADAFTRAAWNEHDCGTANGYAVGGPSGSCDAGGLRTWRGVRFVLASHQIVRNCAGALAPSVVKFVDYSPSPDCVRYRGTKGWTITYLMARLGGHWRVLMWVGAGQWQASGS